MADQPSFGGLKARNVESIIRAHGFDKGIVICLVQLAEYQTVIRESQMEMAGMLDQMVDVVANFSTVAENMSNAVTQLQKKDSGVSDDEIGH